MKRSESDWFLLISQWRGSGVSQADFCRSNDLPVSSFWRWLNHFKRQGRLPATSIKKVPPAKPLVKPPGEFIEIDSRDFDSVTKPRFSRTLVIKTSYGCVLEIPL